MINVKVGSANLIARYTAMLGALLAASACGGGDETTTPPGTGGTGSPQAGASGIGGSGAMAGTGGASTSGGAGAVGGTAGSFTSAGSGGTPSLGGAAGSAPANGGAGAGGGVSGAGAGGTLGGAGSGGASAGMAGMAGSSPAVGGAGAGGTSGAAGSGSETLSFAADIWPVFDKIRDPVFVYRGTGAYESCTTTGVCHGGDDPGAGLSMANADTAYDQLLGVPSNSVLCGDTVRVVAGQPQQSCLILFYEGRLRDDLEWVDTAEIDLVRQWIAEGARP
jgi:hypothetical protein